MPAASWNLTPAQRYGLYLLCSLAVYHFVHFHLVGLHCYLDLAQYVAGTERLPFQYRVLPIVLIRALKFIHFPVANFRGAGPAFSVVPQSYLFLIDLCSFALASALTVRLYRKISPAGQFSFLVFPVFLFAAVWSYLIHAGFNEYYPYDMLSLAFFTAGIYCIYTKRFVPLLLIVVIGSFNRETTLFLVPLYLLDAVAPIPSLRPSSLPWDRVPWAKTALLALAWLAVKLLLQRFFVTNDASENTFRLRVNLRYLSPPMWPQALCGCGYLLPVLVAMRRRIPNVRIAGWVLVIPFWFVVMCCYGELVETRIYGELCPLVAIATTLLIESYATQLSSKTESGGLSTAI